MISYDEAYPDVEFLPRSRNWWAWLKGTPAECVHLGSECDWIATLVPDIICLQGKRRKRRDPVRPEITLCLECLAQTATPDLAEFEGRTIAFEPDPELLTQYFFIERDDFAAAGLRPEVADAISSRLMQNSGACQVCEHDGKWLCSRANKWPVWMKSIKSRRPLEHGFARSTARRNYSQLLKRSKRQISFT